MKKAFTMIELIFVIVVLGILAAIAIPKFTATRDDAQIAKDSANISIAIKDIAQYYTAHGEFAKNWNDMTNVPFVVEGSNATTNQAKFKVKNKNCIVIELVNSQGQAVNEDNIANATGIKLTKDTDVGGICEKLLSLPSIQPLISDDSSNPNGIQVGGSGIFNSTNTQR